MNLDWNIDINRKLGFSYTKFPDGQPHIQISEHYSGTVHVNISIVDSESLLLLLMVSQALEDMGCKKGRLFIKYMMGARYDRIMRPGDSFDLKVISRMINSCEFDSVWILDPHSDVSLALIDRSKRVTNHFLVMDYDIPNSVLICPDAGAAKNVSKYLAINPNIVDVVYCVKVRDVTTGNISLKVLDAEKCRDRSCVVIDDICDGGATFNAIGEQVEAHMLTLIVTHAIFSKGIDAATKYYNSVITTDSRCGVYDSKKVKVIDSRLWK